MVTQKDELIRKLLVNKRNNQVSITLPKKQLDFLRDLNKQGIPKKIKIKIQEVWF